MSSSSTAYASPTTPDTLKRSMEECNIAYLHAQLFNPAMKFVGPVRKTLGVRTLFNLLGPLVNPCCPAYQLLGVADLSQMRLYTNVFYKLGIDFAVVNSLDRYDEISLTDEFKVMTRNYERIYRPQALGFKDAVPKNSSAAYARKMPPASSTISLRGMPHLHKRNASLSTPPLPSR